MTREIYLISEVGINHSGNLDFAKQMIKASADAGMSAVKFQKREISKCYTAAFLDSPRESPFGTTQRAQKEGLEFNHAQYLEIDRYCLELGIDWSASCWDLDSLEFITAFNPPWHKVASPMLGNKPLLRQIAAQKRKTFISTGMCDWPELDAVVEIFRRADCEFHLMHCVSEYPLADEKANILMIPRLIGRYGVKDMDGRVGYSGHETSLLKVCVAAVALGATSIERHVTLNRASYGSDQSASVECHALRDFVETIRAIPAILGDGEKRITDGEWAARKKLWVEAD